MAFSNRNKAEVAGALDQPKRELADLKQDFTPQKP